jgi:type IV secretory pathway TrbL component
MRKLISVEAITFSLLLGLMLFSLRAHAAIDNTNVLDDILARYQGAASAWAAIITERASWLFWLLVTISMVWTFGLMALRRADIGEFFAEFIRFTVFTGFFWSYAGIFFLGFGGSRWTSDIAINYYKTVFRRGGIALCHGIAGRYRQDLPG